MQPAHGRLQLSWPRHPNLAWRPFARPAPQPPPLNPACQSMPQRAVLLSHVCPLSAHKKRPAVELRDPQTGPEVQHFAASQERFRAHRPAGFGLKALLALVTRYEGAPWLGADWTFGLPYDAELTVGLDFTDHDRLVQVMVGLVHCQREAGRCLKGLACHCRANLVDIDRARLFHRLSPHVDADIS